MMEAVISIAMPENWITDVVEKYPSVIRVIDSKTGSSQEVRDLVQIEVENEGDLQKVIDQIRNNLDISALDKSKVLAAFSTCHCVVCKLLAGSDCFLTGSTTTKEGRTRWTLLVTEREALQNLIAELAACNADPQLVKITEIKTEDELTMRQEQITRMAFERGYFDFPRKTDLKELADIFGISTSTLSEILRKGQRRIMAGYFTEHRQY